MSDWEAIAQETATIITALEPVITAANPAIGTALTIAVNLAQGAIAEEPAAVALINQIKSGTVPTQAQLEQYQADYEASYQALDADIEAKLKADGAG